MPEPVNSYDSRRDPLSKDYCRSTAPGRYGYLVVPGADELLLYGKPRIFNSNTAAATVTVVAVGEQDDANTMVITVPAGAVIYENLVVRRVTAISAGVIVHIVA